MARERAENEAVVPYREALMLIEEPGLEAIIERARKRCQRLLPNRLNVPAAKRTQHLGVTRLAKFHGAVIII